MNSPNQNSQSEWKTPLETTKTSYPSWALSAIFHAVLIVILGITLASKAIPNGSLDEATKEVGIVLKKFDTDGNVYYESESSVEGEASDNSSPAPSVQSALEESSSVNINSALPTEQAIIGTGLPTSENGGSTTNLLKGFQHTKNAAGGKAKVKVFGLEGEGYKFTYVFDRSSSMGGSGRNALQAAKAEMLASLDSLASTHQFVLMFYNENPWVFNPAGEGRLSYATDTNKKLAKNYVESMTAAGSTKHEKALIKALAGKPDVIFFLTDADQPILTAAQLHRIGRANYSTAIQCIEFGIGPAFGGDNFLMRLARENGGKYQYIDITRLNLAQPD